MVFSSPGYFPDGHFTTGAILARHDLAHWFVANHIFSGITKTTTL
jgi:hypothetical protein